MYIFDQWVGKNRDPLAFVFLDLSKKWFGRLSIINVTAHALRARK